VEPLRLLLTRLILIGAFTIGLLWVLLNPAEGDEHTTCYLDGVEGVVNIDGSCVTPQVYAEMFSPEAILAAADEVEALGYPLAAENMRLSVAHSHPNPLRRTDDVGVPVAERLFNLAADDPVVEAFDLPPIYPAGTYGTERWRPLVTRWFTLAGIPDEIDNALSVMECESQGRPDARNPSSTATGLFQHLRGFMERNAHHIGLDHYDRTYARHNVAVTAFVVAQDGGWRQWSCKP
jgi:hypothetical protein